MDLHVVSVSEGVLPEVDEEFIKSFGVEDGDLEAFKTEIQNNLERELKQATSTVLKAQLIEALVKAMPDLEVPDSIVRQEAASMAAQMLQHRAGVEPADGSLASRSWNRPKAACARPVDGRTGPAKQHPRRRRKVRQAIETVASTYEEPAEVVQLYYSNQQLLQQVESSVLEEQVVDWVLENAKVTPKEMKFQEVIAGRRAIMTGRHARGNMDRKEQGI